MPVGYAGKSYPLVPQDKMMPSEIDAVERATGLTLQKIRRMGETCVCEHGLKAHTHKDDAGEEDKTDRSCTECDCEQHSGDMPIRVTTGVRVGVREARRPEREVLRLRRRSPL